MVWNIAALCAAVVFLVLTIGLHHAGPLTQADAMAEVMAPRLGIPIATLRAELVTTLREMAGRHVVGNAVPWCVIIVLLAVPLVKGRGGLAGPKSVSGPEDARNG